MGKKYIEDNIETLRKQRDDKVVGGYRDLVVKTYDFIQKKIKKSSEIIVFLTFRLIFAHWS